MRPPIYGRDLAALHASGKRMSWVLLSMGWDYGRPLPRLVVLPDMAIDELDLSMLDGVECMVVHAGEDGRALDLAERALRSGAALCGVFDAAAGKLALTTDEVLAIRGRAAV
jgi:hypothetical protein